MTRIPIIFSRPAGGSFSHFAHFISDFVLPFFSHLRKVRSLDEMLKGRNITLELADEPENQFGPMFHLLKQIFPTIEVQYVLQFSSPPAIITRDPWYNSPEDVDCFNDYLRQVLKVIPNRHGVIIVNRGLNRNNYPGGSFSDSSGADRRTIKEGIEKLVDRVKEVRPDTTSVTLEDLSFADQVSLFLNADTLIAQHGAALVHAHWMPKGGHIIELQCYGRRLSRRMLPVIASLRNHVGSIVYYPCDCDSEILQMKIGNATKVSKLLRMGGHNSKCCL